jgi:3-deoxy-D-arabino-heptulosonate 7-phosphate (DAHP) synthase
MRAFRERGFVAAGDNLLQPCVCRDVIGQITTGDRRIMGVMLESNLVAGAQKLSKGQPLVYGQSITDACIGWDETLELLRELAAAVRSTRCHETNGCNQAFRQRREGNNRLNLG